MNDLNNISLMVKSLLETKPETRNSDEVLYLELIKVYGFNQGRDLTSMSLSHFFTNRKIYGVPKFESVRRTRQKIQATYPELRSDKAVEKARAELEKEYKAFALSETA